LNDDIGSGSQSGQGGFDHEATIARVLAKRRRKANQLWRFKEKQKRQRRWIPLHAPIDWLASFNSQGERTAPDDGKALLFTDEIWNAFCGKDIFSDFQLGSNDFPWCIIEDAHPDFAISRFRRLDLAITITNRKMVHSLIKRLWVPRVPLLKLFQEKRWPVAPWLEEPQPASITNKSPASPTSERTPKHFSVPEAEKAYASRRTGGRMPTINEDTEWAKTERYPIREILKLRQKYKNRKAGQRKALDGK
jgi:hypothetical protein